ncbi:ABC transporter substrate-binding protein [Bosea sp. 2YAB26]|uniref:ABC transporter substrate-binding protein n=1 Tax=Bosea sp. 2YAB26 TaxID=3237478 RepID=UPI003F8FA654
MLVMTRAALRTGLAVAASVAAMAAMAEDLKLLAERAKAEPPMTVYAVTGKIVDTANAFNKIYGLGVTGKKVSEAGQVELLIREHRAGAALASISLAADTASVAAELLPKKVVTSYVPDDAANLLPKNARDPLVFVTDPHVWSYNGAASQSCPVKNVWELTEPAWSRLVTLMDPLERPAYADWFNQLETHHDAAMAAAYATHFGKPFDKRQGSATAAWVKALAANGPLIADSTAVAAAVGAPGQKQPFFGMVPVAKFRDNIDKKFSLTICRDMQPFAGMLYPSMAVVAAGTKSPNTAKLFINYLLTEPGLAPQLVDGKVPTHPKIALPADEPSGIGRSLDRMMAWDLASSVSDLERRQDWQDLWRVNLRR